MMSTKDPFVADVQLADVPEIYAKKFQRAWSRQGNGLVAQWVYHSGVGEVLATAMQGQCHKAFQPHILRYVTDVEDDVYGEVRGLKGSRLITSLTMASTDHKDREYNEMACRWLAFINDPKISPFRRFIRHANPITLAIRPGVDEDVAMMPSHVSILMSPFVKQRKVGYLYLIATRMAVDQPRWLRSWCWYQDEMGLSPVAACYAFMTWVHRDGTALASDIFEPTTPYHHQCFPIGGAATYGLIGAAGKTHADGWTREGSSLPSKWGNLLASVWGSSPRGNNRCHTSDSPTLFRGTPAQDLRSGSGNLEAKAIRSTLIGSVSGYEYPADKIRAAIKQKLGDIV